MFEILVPRPNPNDEQFVVIEWVVEDRKEVRRDELIAVIETTKVAEDIHSPADGFLLHHRRVGQWCSFGEPIGTVVGAEELDTSSPPPSAADGGQEFVLSESARTLAAELGVTTERIASLGKKMIGTADIRALAERDHPGPVSDAQDSEPYESREVLPEGQSTVADVVTRAHREIPAAFAAMKFDIEDALRRIEGNAGHYLGLTELVVKAIAMQRNDHPRCFRGTDTAVADGREAPVNVAVTFDLGRGLKLPVVRDAHAKNLRDIASELLKYRMKAARGTFERTDFTDASIMVSVNFDSSVLFAVPMIFPGLSCAVSIGDPIPEVVLRNGTQPEQRRFVTLGLAYDHRSINGRDAIAFLKAVGERLRDPAGIDSTADVHERA